MINKKIIIAASGLLLLTANLSKAQQNLPEKNFYDMERVRSKTAWLNSQNAAGLGMNQADLSVFNAFYNNEKGSYRNVWNGKDAHMFGLNTESYKKVGKISFYGKLGFDYMTENKRSWSGMIYPGSTPMLIADEIPGQFRRERYMAAAGMSMPLGREFAFGVGVDYQVASNAKRRDARNINDYMNLSVSPGILFKSCPVNIGLNAMYGRRTEKIEYTTFGSMVAPSIYSFDGLWFYTKVPFSTATFPERRFIDDIYGGSLQAEFRITPDIKFFNEFSASFHKQSQELYRSSNEKYGDYDKITYSYSGVLSFTGEKADHNLKLKASFFDMFKYSNVQGFENIGDTSEQIVVQLGRIRNYSEKYYDFGAEYQLFVKRSEWNSSWTAKAGFDYFKTENVYYIYPTTFNQTIHNTHFYGSVSKNILFKRGMLDITIGGGAITGGGIMNDIVTPAGTTIPSGALTQNTELLEHNYNYLTANRAYGKGAVKYTHFLRPETGLGIYAEVSGSLTKVTNNAKFDKTKRSFVQMTVGVNF